MPVVTFDLDVLVLPGPMERVLDTLRGIREWAAERGYPSRAEHIVISDIPVHLLPAPDALSEEALVNAISIETNGITIRVVRPEYLIALWLAPGPARSARARENAAKLLESVQIDVDLLADLTAKFDFRVLSFEKTNRALVRWQGPASPDAAPSFNRKEVDRSVPWATCVSANRKKSSPAQAVGAALEYRP